MCRPSFFDVTYSINPWMDLSGQVDRSRALMQWETLREVYLSLGHEVLEVEPLPGLPDMVFAANGGLVVGEQAIGARFAYPERAGEAPAYLERLRELGLDALPALHVNEGEGDFLVAGSLVLAGSGFRSDPAAHAEVQERFGLPVVSLVLTDPRFYHLDTALGVLAPEEVCYFPGAFSPESRDLLERLFPDAVHVSEEDALHLGLNLVSDGRNVVVPTGTRTMVPLLRSQGFVVHEVEMSELLKAGGAVKCCTMELHSAPVV